MLGRPCGFYRKDAERRGAIAKEARDLGLGGFLKPGCARGGAALGPHRGAAAAHPACDHKCAAHPTRRYPGIVVVEGEASGCEAFVGWIKGSKGAAGGFGRRWGHHVRGEVGALAARQLPAGFEELADDMGALGARCKERGLE